ncbi:MAG: glycosyltransferase family 4 protein, partial [Chthoniobacterales bacterium]
YVTAGGFSLVNQQLKKALFVATPDIEWSCFDAAIDTFQKKPSKKWISQCLALIQFAPVIAKHRIPPRDLMVRLPYFQRCLSEALSSAVKNCDFTLQTQSLFDARVEGIPNFLYTDHTYLANRRYDPPRAAWPASRKWREMEVSLYKQARVCFTTSRFAADSIVEDYGVPRANVEVVYSGCNTDFPDSVARPARPPRRILFVGVEWERKGGPVLLKAFGELHRRFPDATLEIVGCSPAVSASGVIIHGRVERSLIPSFLEKADIFCLPSLAEPSAVALVEASAFALPVVATRVGGTPERLIDGQTGILVAPNDPAGLAEALARLMENGDLAREMGLRGREFVLREFTWNAVAQKMAKRLREELS